MESQSSTISDLPPFPWIYKEKRSYVYQSIAFLSTLLLISVVYSYFKSDTLSPETLAILLNPFIIGITIVLGIALPLFAISRYQLGKLTFFADHFEYEKGSFRLISPWKDVTDVILMWGGNRTFYPTFEIRTKSGKTKIIDGVLWEEETGDARIGQGFAQLKRIEELSGVKARFEGGRYVIYSILLFCVLGTILVYLSL